MELARSRGHHGPPPGAALSWWRTLLVLSLVVGALAAAVGARSTVAQERLNLAKETFGSSLGSDWVSGAQAGATSSAAWSVQDGALLQTERAVEGGDPCASQTSGVFLYKEAPADEVDAYWTDYVVQARVRTDSTGTAGIIYRISQGGDGRFSYEIFDIASRCIRLTTVVDNSVTNARTYLGTDITVATGTWYTLRVEAVGGRIKAYLGANEVFDESSLGGPTKGGVGLYSGMNSAARFDDFYAVREGVMSFSSATFTAPESGTSPAVLTVQLTGRAVKTPDSVLVSYVSTMDDAAGTTAIAGTDYLSKSGDAVSIIGLATTTTVAVSLLNDDFYEADDVFLVRLELNDVSSFVVGEPSTATVSILDDGDISFYFSSDEYLLIEGTTTTVTVVRGATAPSLPDVTVAWTFDSTSSAGVTRGTDFTSDASGQLVFSGSAAERTFEVTGLQNTVFDQDRLIVYRITGLTFSQTQFSAGGFSTPTFDSSSVQQPTKTDVVLRDDFDAGRVGFTQSYYVVDEDIGTLTVTVTREGASDAFVSFSWRVTFLEADTASPSDVLVASGDAVLREGATVTTFPDGMYEEDEVFHVALVANPGSGFRFSNGETEMLANVTILDNNDATLAFVASSATFMEGDGEVAITISRRQAADNGRSVTAVVGVATGSGVEANPGSACSLQELPCGSSERVDYRTLSAATNTRSVAVSSGVATATFPLTICDDTVANGDVTLQLVLQSASPAGSASVDGPFSSPTMDITIRDNGDGGTLQFTTTAFEVSEDAGHATLTVTRAGGSSCAVTASMATADGTARAEDEDYEPLISGTINFNDGQSSATKLVGILDDDLPEYPHEYFQVSLSVPEGSLLTLVDPFDEAHPSQANVTILDDGDAGIFIFVPTAMSVPEWNNASQTFTVSRTRGAGIPVTLDYATADGTAVAPGDYEATGGTLSFGATDRIRTVTVRVWNDPFYEDPDEVFYVKMSNPTPPAQISEAAGTATVTIEDDGDVTLAFAAASLSVREDAGSATVTLTRFGRAASLAGEAAVSCAPVSGNRAVLDVAYSFPASCGATFAADETTATFVINIINDDIYVSDETAVLELRSPTSGDLGGPLGRPRTTLTILDDGDAGTLLWSRTRIAFVEDVGLATLTVTRQGGTSGTVTARVSAVSNTAIFGVDFSLPSAQVSVMDTESRGTFLVSITNDDLLEPDEDFTLVLSAPSNGALLGAAGATTITITIQDDGDNLISFSETRLDVEEGDKTETVTVTRAGSTEDTVYMDLVMNLFDVVDGGNLAVLYNSETGAGDFTFPSNTFLLSGTVYKWTGFSIPAGASERTILLTFYDNDVFTPSKNFPIQIQSVRTSIGGSTRSQMLDASKDRVRVYLEDDGDAGTASFTVSSLSVYEWQGAIEVTVRRIGPSTALAVVSAETGPAPANSATAGQDYVRASKQFVFEDGVAEGTLRVSILDDDIPESPDETFLITLRPGIGGLRLGNGTVTVTILDDGQDVGIGFTESNPSMPEDVPGGFFTMTLTRTGQTALDVQVDYITTSGTATSPMDFIAQDTPVTLAMIAGVTTRTLAVQIIQDSVFEDPDETFNILLSNEVGISEPPLAAQPILAAVDEYGNPVGTGGITAAVLLTKPLTAGTFRLDYNGEATAPLAFGATAADLESALSALASVETVSVAKNDTEDSYRWVITFPIYDWTTVIPGAGAPTVLWKRSAVQRVSIRSNATLTAGTFRLQFGDSLSGAVAFDADAGTLQTALEAAVGSGGATVSVDPAPGVGIFRSWLLTFSGASNEGPQRQLVPLYTKNAVQTFSCSDAAGGSFILAIGAEKTAPIAWDATADALATAVAALGVGEVSVQLVSGSSVCGASHAVIQFLANPNTLPTMTFETVVWTEYATHSFTCAATAGSFSLSFGEDTASGIGYAAPASFIETQLETYWSDVEDVVVTFSSGSQACSADGVTVTVTFVSFINAPAGPDFSAMVVGTEALVPSSSIAVTTTPGTRDDLDGTVGPAAELVGTDNRCRIRKRQSFVCLANNGHFSVHVDNEATWPDETESDGSTAPKKAVDISAFATAEEVATALSQIAHLNLVFVEFVNAETACARLGNNVILTFERETWSLQRDPAAYDFPSLTIDATNADGAQPPLANREVTQIEVQSFTCLATTGAVSFTYDGSDLIPDVGALSTAADIKSKFEELSNIREVTVAISGGDTMCGAESANTVTVTFTNVFSLGPLDDGNLAEVLVDPTNGGTNPLDHETQENEIQSIKCPEESQGGRLVLSFPVYGGGQETLTVGDPRGITAGALDTAIEGDSALSNGGYSAVTVSVPDGAIGFCANPVTSNPVWELEFVSFSAEAPAGLITATIENVVPNADSQTVECSASSDETRVTLTLGVEDVLVYGNETVAEAEATLQAAWTSLLTLQGTAGTVCDPSGSTLTMTVDLPSLAAADLAGLSSGGLLTASGSGDVTHTFISLSATAESFVTSTQTVSSCNSKDGLCKVECEEIADAASCDDAVWASNCKANGPGESVARCIWSSSTTTTSTWEAGTAPTVTHATVGTVSAFRADFTTDSFTLVTSQVQAWNVPEPAISNFTEVTPGIVSSVAGQARTDYGADATMSAFTDFARAGSDCASLTPAIEESGNAISIPPVDIEVQNVAEGVASCSDCAALASSDAIPEASVSLASNGDADQEGSLTAAIAPAFNPRSGTLSGTAVTPILSGHAQFSDLGIDNSGLGYALSVSGTVGGAETAVSALGESFNVAPAVLMRLVIESVPRTPLAGPDSTLSVEVTTVSQDGALVLDNTTVVTASLVQGDADALQGTTYVQCAAGVASFTDLRLVKQGRGYIIRFSADATPFEVDLPPIDMVGSGATAEVRLEWDVSTLEAGRLPVPQPSVALYDALGNARWGAASGTVEVSLLNSSLADASSLVLNGTTADVRAGRAQFSALTIARNGSASLPATVFLRFALAGGPSVDAGPLTVAEPPAVPDAVLDCGQTEEVFNSTTVTVMDSTTTEVFNSTTNTTSNVTTTTPRNVTTVTSTNVTTPCPPGPPVVRLGLSGVPGDVAAGAVIEAFTGAGINVTLYNADDEVVTRNRTLPFHVVASLAAATAEGRLLGTVVSAAEDGVAVFRDLSVRRRGNYTLRFELSEGGGGVWAESGAVRVGSGAPVDVTYRQLPLGALSRTTPVITPSESAVVTILDDGDAGELRFVATEGSIMEAAEAVHTLTVTRVRSSSGDMVVQFQPVAAESTATFRSDWTFVNPDNPLLAFVSGEVLKTFSVLTKQDDVYEYPDEVASIRLEPFSSGSLVDASANGYVLTILDDGDAGTLQFVVDSYSTAEGRTGVDVTATLTVSRVGRTRPSGNITVSYASQSGTATAGEDFVATEGVLSFGDAVTSQTLTVVVRDDEEYEFPDEELTVSISDVRYLNQSGIASLHIGAPNVSTLTILDDGDAGTLGFGPRDSVVEEPNAGGNESLSVRVHVLTVTRTHRLRPELTIKYRTISNGTATIGEGGDMAAAAGTLTFAEDVEAVTIPVEVLDDDAFEYPDEVAQVELYDIRYLDDPTVYSLQVDAANRTASVTIKDDGDAGSLQFTALSYSASEVTGGVGAAVLTVTREGRPVPSGTLQIGYSTADGTARNGSDYVLTAGEVIVTGESATFSIPVLDDDEFEFPDETLTARLFNIRYRNETVYSLTIGEPRETTVTIKDDGDYGPPAFAPHEYAIEEGGNDTVVEVTLTVSRTERASPSGHILVEYYTREYPTATAADFVPVEGVLNMTEGQQTATLTVSVLDDFAFEFPDEVFTVGLRNITFQGNHVAQFFGQNRTASVTILDDGDAGTLTFIPHLYTPMETPGGSLATFTVSRTGRKNYTAELVVVYESLDGGAEGTTARPKLFPYAVSVNNTTVVRDPYVDDGEDPAYDYVPTVGELTFPAGVFTRTLTMPIADDLVYEAPDEVVLLHLRDVQYEGQVVETFKLGETRTMTAQILDDGDAGTLQFSSALYTVSEAAGSAVEVTVTRVGREAPDGAISVEYRTVDGTATTADRDYEAFEGTLLFGTNVTAQTFLASALDDSLFEWPNERFGLELFGPRYGNLTIYSTRLDPVLNVSEVEIQDDGDSGTMALTLFRAGGGGYSTILNATDQIQLTESRSPEEETTNHVLTVTRLRSASGNVTLRYRTNASNPLTTASEADYAEAAGELSFSDGVKKATLTFTTKNDVEFECPDEVVTLELYDYQYLGEDVPSLRVAVADNMLRIVDDGDAGKLSFVNTSASVPEEREAATVTLTLTRQGRDEYATAAQVSYAAVAGTASVGVTEGDVVSKAGTLVFEAAAPQQTLTFVIRPDDVFEYPDEVFSVKLFDGRYEAGAEACVVQLEDPDTGADNPSAVFSAVTIEDDGDAGTFSFAPSAYEAAENATTPTTLVLTITRTGRDSPSQNVTAAYGSVDGTATAGQDYTATSGLVEFLDGEHSKTVSVVVLDDLVWEFDVALEAEERFEMSLTSLLYRGEPNKYLALGATPNATVEVLDDGDAGTFAFGPWEYYVNETNGASTLGTLTITRVGRDWPSGALTVVYETVAGTADGTDFTELSGERIAFADGQTNGTIVVEILPDDEFEYPDQEFTVRLTAVEYEGVAVSTVQLGAGGIAPATATVTIGDDGDAGTLMFAPVEYASLEGTTATLTVTRTGRPEPSGDLTVAFATEDGVAVAGADYTASDGTLTFTADSGDTTKTLTVALKQDDVFEYPDEVLFVALSNVQYVGAATISHYSLRLEVNETATVTVQDDGDAGTFSLDTGTVYSVREGNGSAVVQVLTVLRTGGTSKAITVEYGMVAGTAGPADYVDGTFMTTLKDGESEGTLEVTVLDDDVWEYPDEVFQVAILDLLYQGERAPSLQVGAESMAPVTIEDDGDAGTLAFQSGSFTQEEGGNGLEIVATVTVTRYGRPHPSQNITVDVSIDPEGTTATENADYRKSASTLSFADGQTMETFTMTILDDDDFEYPDDEIRVVLQNVRYKGQPAETLHIDGTRNDAQVTIKDDGDGGTFAWSSSTYSIAESGDGSPVTAVVTITRTGRESPSAEMTVEWRTLDSGSATAGADFVAVADTDGETPYVGVLVTFADGQTLTTVAVVVEDDDEFEFPDENVPIELVAVRYKGEDLYSTRLGNLTEADVLILDDGDAGTFRFAQQQYEVAEGDGGPSTVTLSIERVEGTSKGLTVRYSTVGLGDEGGAGATARGSDGAEANDYVTSSGVVSFGDGVAAGELVVVVNDDGEFEWPDEELFVVLDRPLYLGTTAAPTLAVEAGADRATVTIKDDGDAGTLSFGPQNYTVAEGNGGASNVTVTVTRQGRDAPSGEITVSFASTPYLASQSDFVETTGELTFGDGVTARTFVLEVLDDVEYEYPDEVVRLDLSAPLYLGVTIYAVTLEAPTSSYVTIEDDGDAGTVTFLLGSQEVWETDGSNEVHTVTVTRVGRAVPDGRLTVQFEFAEGTATEGTAAEGGDFVGTPGTLTFGAGVTSQTVEVTVVHDDLFEFPDETLTITLSQLKYSEGGVDEAVHSVQLGENVTTTLTILDDGDAGTLGFQVLHLSEAEVHEGTAEHVVTVTRTGRSAASGTLTITYEAADVTAVGGGVDYTLATGVLTFPDGGDLTQTFAVVVEHDNEYEYPDEELTVTLRDVQYLAATRWSLNIDAAKATATLTIKDDGDGGTFGFAPTAYSIMEGNGSTVDRTLTVTRTGRDAPSKNFTIRYESADGVAVQGGAVAEGRSDYTYTAGSLTFLDGETEHTFVVPVEDDAVWEYPDESFFVDVSDLRYRDAAGALQPSDYSMRIDAGTDRATVVIVDDGDAGTLEFKVTQYSAAEAGAASGSGATTVTLTITRVGREIPSQPISVGYTTADGTASAGSDFTATTAAAQRVALGDGVREATIVVQIDDDDVFEHPDEVLTVLLEDVRYDDPAGGQVSDVASLHISAVNTSTVTILDDGDAGTFAFDALALEEFEGDGATAVHVVTVTRQGRDAGGSAELTIRYRSANGTAGSGADYVATEGVLTFGDRVVTQTFEVQVVDDMLYERPDEVLYLELLDVRYAAIDAGTWSLRINAARNETTLTIKDDGDAGTMAFAPLEYSIMEGGAAGGAAGADVIQTYTVTRYGREKPDRMFTLQYTVADGTATAGEGDFEFTTGNLTFGDEVTSQTFTVVVQDDVLYEYPDETFTVTIDTYSYLGTHVQDYSARIDAANHTSTTTIVDDGDAGTLQFALPAEYSATEVADQQVTVTATVTRTNREAPSQEIYVKYRTVDGTAVGGGAEADFIADEAEITFADGVTVGTFTVVVNDDTFFEFPSELFTVELFDVGYGPEPRARNTASLYIGSPASANVTILDDGDAGTFEWADHASHEGGSYYEAEPNSGSIKALSETVVTTVTITRRRSQSKTIVLTYQTADGVETAESGSARAPEDYEASTGTITFTDSEAVGTVPLTVKDDVVYEYPDEEFLVHITQLRYIPDGGGEPEEVDSLVIGAANVTTVTIKDDGDAGTIQFVDPPGGYTFPESFPIGLQDNLRLEHGALGAPQRPLLITLTLTRTSGTTWPEAPEVTPGTPEEDGLQRDGRVQIRYSTEDATAEGGSDYAAQSQTEVIFEPRVTRELVVVNLIDDAFYNDQVVDGPDGTFTFTEDPDGETFLVKLDDVMYRPNGTALGVYSVQLGSPTTVTVTVTDDGDLGTLGFCIFREEDDDLSTFQCDRSTGQLNAAVKDCNTASELSCPDIPEGVKFFYIANEADRRAVFAVFRYGWSGMHRDIEVLVETADPLGWVQDYFDQTTATLTLADVSVRMAAPDQQNRLPAFEQREFTVPLVDDEAKVDKKVFLLDLSVVDGSLQPAFDADLQRMAVLIQDDDTGTLILCSTTEACFDRDSKTERETIMYSLPEVTEGSEAGVYSMMLKTDPATAFVTVTITPQPEYEVTTSKDNWASPRSATLTFTTDNFAIPQPVWFRAVDDNVRRGDTYVSAIRHTSSSANLDFDDSGGMLYVPAATQNSLCANERTSCTTGTIYDNDGGIRMEVSLDNEDGTLSLEDIEDEDTFRQNLVNDICQSLGIDCSRIRIISVTDT